MRKLLQTQDRSHELSDAVELAIKLGGFALLLVYTRYLSPTEFGVLALLYVTVRVVDTFVVQGMTSAVARACIRPREDDALAVRTVSSTAFWYTLACAVIVFGIFALVAEPVGRMLFDERSWTDVVRWFAVAGVLRAAQNVPRHLLRMRGARAGSTLLDLAHFVVAAGLNLYFVVAAGRGLVGIAYAEMIREALFLVVTLIAARGQLAWAFSRSELATLLRNGLPKVPRGVSYLASSVSDRFFLAHYATNAHLGLYAFAYRFAELLELGTRPLTKGLPELHRLGREQPDHGRALVGRYVTYFVALIGVLGLGIVVFTRPLLELVTPIEYFPVVKLVPWLTLALCFASTQRIVLLGVHLQQGPQVVPRVMSIAALVNLACNFWWISGHGMWGAAVATTITHAFLCVVTFVLDHRHYGTRWEVGRLARVVATVAITYGISVWATPENLVGQIAAGMAVVLLYPALLGVLGFYTDDELERLRELVNHRVSLRPTVDAGASRAAHADTGTQTSAPPAAANEAPAKPAAPSRPLQPR